MEDLILLFNLLNKTKMPIASLSLTEDRIFLELISGEKYEIRLTDIVI